MRDRYRWAALAGAAMLALSSINTGTVWADEVVQDGSTMENAVDGTAAAGGQAADTGTDPSGAASTGQAPASAEDIGQAPSDSGSTGTVRVIRVVSPSETDSAGQGGAPASEGSAQNGSSAPGGAPSGVAYSGGPGFASSPGQSDQPAQEEDIQIVDVADPIVKSVEKYTHDQMAQDIALLQQRYGSRMQVSTIGTSLDGRALYDCIVGNPAASKHILVQAGIHGREYLNPMLLMQQMEMALANYDTGSFHGTPLSSMFSQVAIHFVPMTNPDGISISQFGLDGLRSQELKEAVARCYMTDLAAGRTDDFATYLTKWKANAQGVDLNVNFDAQWETIYTAATNSYSGYKGTAPGSEPESKAMIALYQSHYPWKAVINYHSMGNVIYWDILGNKVQGPSLELAQLMSAVTGGYQILPSEGGGGYKDWIQLCENPVPSVTLETGSVTCPIPLSGYGEIWSRNRLTWAYAMEWVMGR